MRVSRFYTGQPLTEGASIGLDEETAHYITRVLRLGPGAALILFNGDGNEYHALLEDAGKKRAQVKVGHAVRPQRESPLHITLGQGISRGERMDFVLQKSVELGVSAITPLWTVRSQVRLSGKRLDKRLSHWRGIMRSASEQSGRVILPGLNDACSLGDWCRAATANCRLVLDPQATLTPGELPPADDVCVLIGPEGGLDAEEIDSAATAGFQRVRLGPRVLRTETAALAALAVLQTLWGDLAGRTRRDS